MATRFRDYQNRYENLRMERTPDGVLTVAMHSNDKEHVHTGKAHHEFPEAFAEIANDPENEVVIYTGTGDIFLTTVDFATVADNTLPLNWFRILTEARRMFQSLLDIQVPIIAAVNGPAFLHSEYALLSDIVLASDRAEFADKGHYLNGIVPADGVQVGWELAVGPQRARYYLLTGKTLSSGEALQLGAVHEVVPHAQLMDRARELARDLLKVPPLTRRYTRLMMTRRIRAQIAEVPFDMGLEGITLSQMRLKDVPLDSPSK